MRIFAKICACMFMCAMCAASNADSNRLDSALHYDTPDSVIKHGFHGVIEFKTNTNIYGKNQLEAIKLWGLEKSAEETMGNVLDNGSLNPLKEKITGLRAQSGLGELFMILQNKYFKLVFFGLIIAVPLAFFGHFMIIGQRRFNHHQKLRIFSKFNIIVHWCAAVPFVLICLTGLIMVFGAYLGGGTFVRLARDIHGLATPVFTVFGILMFCMWAKDAMPKKYDIEWFKIMGGYLSKENRPIPSGKFNAGQKLWFWIALVGGAVMVASGGIMFFQSSDINTLRLMAITHNVCGMMIIAMLITHIYMALFAIEGAIEAIINGEMGEEEVSILHSIYYKELESSGKLNSMRVAHGL